MLLFIRETSCTSPLSNPSTLKLMFLNPSPIPNHSSAFTHMSYTSVQNDEFLATTSAPGPLCLIWLLMKNSFSMRCALNMSTSAEYPNNELMATALAGTLNTTGDDAWLYSLWMSSATCATVNFPSMVLCS